MTKHSIMQEGVSDVSNAYCTHITASLRSTHDHSVSIPISFITLILSCESLRTIMVCQCVTSYSTCWSV